jgi:hypothetical protein
MNFRQRYAVPLNRGLSASNKATIDVQLTTKNRTRSENKTEPLPHVVAQRIAIPS